MICPILEARAEMQKYFCSIFGSNENFKICFRNLLTFSFSYVVVHSFPSWLVWAEVKFMVHVALPKQPINPFKPVQQNRKQALRAYCPIYILCRLSYNVLNNTLGHSSLSYFIQIPRWILSISFQFQNFWTLLSLICQVFTKGQAISEAIFLGICSKNQRKKLSKFLP